MKKLAYFSAQKSIKEEDSFLRGRNFIKDLNHIDQMWEYLNNNNGDILAVKNLRGKNKEELTYNQLHKKITKASKAFVELGLGRGEVVALISENSPKWLIVDQAIMRIGAIDAVRGCNSPSLEIEYIIQHSKSVGLIIQSKSIWEKLDIKDEIIENLKFLIVLEDESFGGFLGWNEFLNIGNDNSSDKYEELVDKCNVEDIATILYTSGTTGKPKGVPLSHGNLLHQISNLACIADPKPGTSVLSVLPIWHSYERSAEYFFFSCGCSQFYTIPKFLKDDIKQISPSVMATVPRLWEAIYDGFFSVLKKMPNYKRNLINLLLKNSSSYKKNLRKIRNIDLYERNLISKFISLLQIIKSAPVHKLASFLLWPNILKQLCGKNLKFPINGGGALPEHVDLFFESLGVNVLVGYGLTETSPVLTCRRTWCNVRGSSGQPLPFTEVKIVDENNTILNYREIGRIFVRGPQVFEGYLDNVKASLDVLTIEGWFDTGDLGFLIPNGSLVITGRAKDTIVLSSGENIEPNPLEVEILSFNFINQVQLVGQDQKNLSALIVPNFELMENKFGENNLKKINQNIEIKKYFKSQINCLLKDRSGSRKEEQIIDLIFVEPFSLENDLLTQTLKQKRKEIEKKYFREIQEMYKKQIKGEIII
tara:strand:- start:2 stop:1948 length:1947 start_codon:yes stop_codon:yes gene_type:complete